LAISGESISVADSRLAFSAEIDQFTLGNYGDTMLDYMLPSLPLFQTKKQLRLPSKAA